ncbi:SAF domain-containing protein [Sanguibacter suaedae]|uniref:SAF domain-containing protein n=1 Tax=Sanguibacter suaedae TaxID=2795737 RepID=A0A934IAU0_9MICO|nr:SAF domain-containing protein [Sanguibacter suaedae]MBI9115325.1 hypothetical protein [Sanguibacter suaedae]
MSSSTTAPAVDRRRQREERGVRSSQSAKVPSDRLPAAPRERRPLLAALAVLLIVGGATVAGLLALRVDDRVPVLVAAQDISAGALITEDLVTTTPVASEGTSLVPEEDASLVVGTYARNAIEQGQLIDARAGSASPALAGDVESIGAALAPGRLPAGGLQPGDVVRLVSTATPDGETLFDDARVASFVSAGSGAYDGSSGGTVSILVPDADPSAIDRLASVIAAEQLTVVLVSRGEPFEVD